VDDKADVLEKLRLIRVRCYNVEADDTVSLQTVGEHARDSVMTTPTQSQATLETGPSLMDNSQEFLSLVDFENTGVSVNVNLDLLINYGNCGGFQVLMVLLTKMIYLTFSNRPSLLRPLMSISKDYPKLFSYYFMPLFNYFLGDRIYSVTQYLLGGDNLNKLLVYLKDELFGTFSLAQSSQLQTFPCNITPAEQVIQPATTASGTVEASNSTESGNTRLRTSNSTESENARPRTIPRLDM
jgi:hypothetical protein